MEIGSGLKNRIKKAARLLLGTRPENMPAIIEKADVVSFDIFDSLVRRDVPFPDSVHHLAARAFYLRTGRRLPDYFSERKHAEAAARIHAANREITIHEIFGELKSVDEADRKLLMELEQEIEWEVCCADSDMKRVFDQALNAGKHVVITSDMYLPESTIRRILEKCGYCGYEKLYLSSSCKVTKASGKLYRLLCEDYQSSFGSIIHIGDNVKSDFFRAGQAGLKPVLVRGRAHTLRFRRAGRNQSFDAACFRAFLSNHKPKAEDDRDDLAVSIGYEVLGPLLGGYCRWLKAKAERCEIRRIFFLSREGSLLKRAYEEVYPQREETTAYLYVSRRALQVPMLLFCHDFHDLCSRIKPLMREHKLSSIGEICRLGAEYEEGLAALHLNPEEDIFQIPEKVQNEYFHLVMDLGRDSFSEQYALVKEYLAQEGFCGAVILSDIGWQGTMQQAISGYCADDATLCGCYMGCWNPPSETNYEKLSRNGYLTAPGRDKEMELLLRFSCDVVETLFTNSDGSVMAYAKEGDKIIPVLQANELDESNRRFLQKVQDYALNFLQDIKRSRIYEQADIPEESVAEGVRRLLRNPSRHTVNCFKDCRFLNGALRSMLPDHSLRWYLIHPAAFISDLEKSSCKLFFLRDVFKLPLPYFQLLKLARENLGVKSSNQKKWLEH